MAKYFGTGIITKDEIDWCWQRLRELVIAGRDDLRELRNKFGLASQGKGTVTGKDVDNAYYHVRQAQDDGSLSW